MTENYKIIKFANDINAFNNKYNTKYINIYMYIILIEIKPILY